MEDVPPPSYSNPNDESPSPDPLSTLSDCVFLDGIGLGSTSDNAETIAALKDRFPKLPAASPYFHAALKACEPMIYDRSHWPTPPRSDEPDHEPDSNMSDRRRKEKIERLKLEQERIWSYVFTAISFLYVFFPPTLTIIPLTVLAVSVSNYHTLCLRAPTHGEGWADVNIWAHLWDHAFLKSDTLTIDR